MSEIRWRYDAASMQWVETVTPDPPPDPYPYTRLVNTLTFDPTLAADPSKLTATQVMAIQQRLEAAMRKFFRAAFGGSAPGISVINDGITLGHKVGWRCWRLKLQGGRRSNHWALKSCAVGHTWEPGVAGMTKQPDDVEDDELGFHAFKDRDQAEVYAADVGNPKCLGRVALWGNIIEHELGWRAQYAYPLSIAWAMTPEQIDAIHRHYGMARST